MNSEPAYTVYCVVNRKNGNCYYGFTRRSIEARRREHLRDAIIRKVGENWAFYKALRKYGPDGFSWYHVATFTSQREALDEEKRLIRDYNAEYNSTCGGEAYHPRYWSPEARRKVGDLSRGNKYFLGKTHTLETRTRLREIGIRDKEKWLKRSHLGPAASAKRVVCIDDGKTYPSASAAARAYGVCVSAVIEVCLRDPRRKCVGDRVFRYEGDHRGGKKEADAERAKRLENRRRRPLSLKKPVICLNDGRTFPGAEEAGRAYGANRSSICEVCRGEKGSVRGKVFRYINELRVTTGQSPDRSLVTAR